MSTATIEVPADLVARLESVAVLSGTARRELVREALEKFFAGQPEQHSPPTEPVSAYELVKDLCGMFEGPGELSYNPKHMEGFGKD